MRRILLIGGDGQVGQALRQTLFPLGELIVTNRSSLELSKPELIKELIAACQPTIIVNAAAYTSVDRAEQESDLAYLLNFKVPELLALLTQEINATLIHLSTDYVFDGFKRTPYLETDIPNPLSIYGKSKLAGEVAIQAINCPSIIIRTAWVYSAFGKNNFVKTMLRLGAEQEEIKVVCDQIGSPTWAMDVAKTIAELISQLRSEMDKIYHYTNSGTSSWYDFALAIFEEARLLGMPLCIKNVIPITTQEYHTRAKRPEYSVLSGDALSRELGHVAPHWRQSLRQMLTELYAKSF